MTAVGLGAMEGVAPPIMAAATTQAKTDPMADMRYIPDQRQNNLARIGLPARIQQAALSVYYSSLGRPNTVGIAFDGWVMDYPDPEDILDIKFNSKSPLNDHNYANPDVDKLLDAARSEQNKDKRLDLYRQAEKLIIADGVWIPLYFQTSHQVVNAAVKGWFNPPMVLPRLRFIEVTR